MRQLYQETIKLVSLVVVALSIGCTPQNKKESGGDNTIVISSPNQNPYTSTEDLIVLKGSCVAGGTVNLGGDSVSSQQCVSGSFSFPIKQTQAGSYTYTISQTLKNGATVKMSSDTSFVWNKTTTTLALPLITSPASNPFFSNSSTLTLSGTCESGNKIYLTGSASNSVDCVSGAFSFSIPNSSDGQYNFSLVQGSVSTSAMSGVVSFQWNRDTAAPLAPAVLLPAVSPFTSNSNSLTISGTCETQNTVFISGDATNSMLCAAGVFSFSDSKTVDGTYNYSLTQTDKAGNASAATSVQWIRSSVPPAPPVITVPATASVTNNLSAQTLSGTCSTGDTVEISGAYSGNVTCAGGVFSFSLSNSTDGTYNYSVLQRNPSSGLASSPVAQTWIRDTVSPSALVISSPAVTPYYFSGASISVSGSCETGTTINVSGAENLTATCVSSAFTVTLNMALDGNYNYSFSQTDGAGNNSPVVSINWIKDATPPLAPTVTSFVSPLTNNASSITVAGACETGATVNVSGDFSSSAVCAAGSYSFSVTKSSDGNYSFNLTQTDTSANVSPQTSVSWNRDTLAPAAVVVTSPNSSPFGSSNTSLVLNGSCETDATVYLSGDAAANSVCVANSFSFTVNKTLDQTYNFNLLQTDVAGNSSSSVGFSWIKDSSTPASPALILPATNPYNSNTSTITISGTCVNGFNVEISGSYSSSVVCAAGSFSFIDMQTVDGAYNYSLIQRNLSGTASLPITLTWNRDTVSPSVPVITSPSVNPKYSNASSLTLSGTCETGAVVSISGDYTGTTSCTSSSFSFNISKSTDAVYNFAIKQTDVAGNASGTANFSWHRDTVIPAMVSITAPVDNPFASGDTNLTITGSCEAATTVYLSGDATASVVCSALGSYSFSVSKLVDGTYNYNIAQTDLAGNASAALAFQWIRDTSVPSTPTVVTPASLPYQSNTNTISISVTCDSTLAPSKGDVNLDGDVLAAEVLSPVGVLSQACNTSPVTFVIQKTTDGTYNFTLNQENPNAGTTSANVGVTWIRDTVAPGNPSVTSPAVSPFTAPGSLTLVGSCINGNTISISGDLTDTLVCDGAGSFTFVDPKSVDGTYNYVLKQTDIAGNTSAGVNFQWVRDSNSVQPPVITVPASTILTSNSSALTISGTCTTGYVVSISGDVDSSEVTSPVNSLSQNCVGGTFSFVVAKTTDNVYSFDFIQSFNGVDSSAENVAWTRDTLAPVASFTATPSSPNITQTVNVSFTSDDPSAKYECKLDAAAYASCTSPKSLTGLTNASHTFYVRATDTAMNVSNEISYTWTQAAYNALALYHLDSASVATDSSSFTQIAGFNHNLTTVGAPANDTTGKYPTGSPNSRSFGTSNYYTASSSGALNAGNSTMTIQGYVKITTAIATTGNYYTLVSKSDASPNLGWELRLKKASSSKYTLNFVGSLNGTTSTTVSPGSSTWSLTVGTWYFYTVTWNKGTVKFYWNSTTAKGTGTIGTAGSSVLFNSTAPLRLGASSTSGTGSSLWLAGSLDELRLSQTVRTVTVPTAPYTAD